MSHVSICRMNQLCRPASFPTPSSAILAWMRAFACHCVLTASSPPTWIQGLGNRSITSARMFCMTVMVDGSAFSRYGATPQKVPTCTGSSVLPSSG
ncbi:hypothetical protein D3C83_52490 [compost metagenome]